jgi:predicted dinucleotide-binding enzyme
MKVVTIGKGNIGGGLARLWRDAGHEVTEIGREGGDASGADAVLLAVPSGAIGDALASVSGIGSTPVIDATNFIGGERPAGFDSLAEYVKSVTGAPVAKAFNSNFAVLYDRLGKTRARPSMVYAADDEARDVTEQLIRDAGYDPVSVGGLDAARAVEDFLKIVFGAFQAGGSRVMYRIAVPEEL